MHIAGKGVAYNDVTERKKVFPERGLTRYTTLGSSFGRNGLLKGGWKQVDPSGLGMEVWLGTSSSPTCHQIIAGITLHQLGGNKPTILGLPSKLITSATATALVAASNLTRDCRGSLSGGFRACHIQ